VSCRGRIINKRGYPSAFWQLLHYITAQAEDKEAKRVAEILSEFTSTFYYCDRSGNGIFIRLLLKYMFFYHSTLIKKPIKATSFELAMEEYPPHKVHDTKSLVMWLWRLHNHINQELMADTNLDLNMYGEKDTPKIIYPPEKSKHFPRSEDDIFDYLSKFAAFTVTAMQYRYQITLNYHFSGQVPHHEPCMARRATMDARRL